MILDTNPPSPRHWIAKPRGAGIEGSSIGVPVLAAYPLAREGTFRLGTWMTSPASIGVGRRSTNG